MISPCDFDVIAASKMGVTPSLLGLHGNPIQERQLRMVKETAYPLYLPVGFLRPRSADLAVAGSLRSGACAASSAAQPGHLPRVWP